MSIKIADITFDHHHYDQRGDVLYLNVGAPRVAAWGSETPEGHAVHYDKQGAVVGLTLLNVRLILERDGELRITLARDVVVATGIEPALVAA